MNNFKKRLEAQLRPRAVVLSLVTCLVLTIGCRRTVIDKKDLRDFQQVNLIANNEKYNPKLTDSTLRKMPGGWLFRLMVLRGSIR